MGNTVTLCVNSRYVNTNELVTDLSKDDIAISDEYKCKTKTDDFLRMLVTSKAGVSTTPKTYYKGKVKVSVF